MAKPIGLFFFNLNLNLNIIYVNSISNFPFKEQKLLFTLKNIIKSFHRNNWFNKYLRKKNPNKIKTQIPLKIPIVSKLIQIKIHLRKLSTNKIFTSLPLNLLKVFKNNSFSGVIHV